MRFITHGTAKNWTVVASESTDNITICWEVIDMTTRDITMSQAGFTLEETYNLISELRAAAVKLEQRELANTHKAIRDLDKVPNKPSRFDDYTTIV